MYFRFDFCTSAFKHGIKEKDILWAFRHYKYDGPLDDFENKFLRIGTNLSGNLLEIMYNEKDKFTVKIFHAMKCRSIYYPLLKA